MVNKKSQLEKVKTFLKNSGTITTRDAHRVLNINQPYQIIKLYRDKYGLDSAWVTNGVTRFKIYYTRPGKLNAFIEQTGLRVCLGTLK